jgi:hypothetical protein
MPLELTEMSQPPGSVLVFSVAGAGDTAQLVAFDQDDSSEIAEDVARQVLVYFKQQFANDGYAAPNVVPAGYMPASKVIYRYLPLLRMIRAQRRFRYDVYCRFGLRYGGEELRRKAHELLSAGTDFHYEGGLFRYPGGPDKTPYRKYLFEIARAKVCVDMPGNGDFCKRLIDYLAVGACVVKPPPHVRLPIRLIDGTHVVYCASDLSDLPDVCAQLVRDDETRESIARNARDFFDRHLDRRQLVQRYLDDITDAQAAVGRPTGTTPHCRTTGRERIPQRRVGATRRPRVELRRIVAAAMILLLTLVALPEALGDRPYDPRPSRVARSHFH